MPLSTPNNPFWTKQLRNPVGFFLVLIVPIFLLLFWLLTGGPAERWLNLLLVGWTLTSLLPTALLGLRDKTMEVRWRAMPLGAGDLYIARFAAMFPLALVTAELLVLGGLLVGPLAERSPYLFTVGALFPAVMVALGLAVAGWCRSAWQLAGGLGIVLAICMVGILPGGRGLLALVLPTAMAREAMLGLGNAATLATALVKLAIEGIVLVILGVVGYARR